MSQEHNALDLIALTLIESRLNKGDEIFVFSAGNLRGKLMSVNSGNCVPSATYRGGKGKSDEQIEHCARITYIPRPRDREKVQDPSGFKFTRKPVDFDIPTRLASDALHLHPIGDKRWMVNVVTSVK